MCLKIASGNGNNSGVIHPKKMKPHLGALAIFHKSRGLDNFSVKLKRNMLMVQRKLSKEIKIGFEKKIGKCDPIGE